MEVAAEQGKDATHAVWHHLYPAGLEADGSPCSQEGLGAAGVPGVHRQPAATPFKPLHHRANKPNLLVSIFATCAGDMQALLSPGAGKQEEDGHGGRASGAPQWLSPHEVGTNRVHSSFGEANCFHTTRT